MRQVQWLLHTHVIHTQIQRCNISYPRLLPFEALGIWLRNKVVEPGLKLEMSCFLSPFIVLFLLPKHAVVVSLNMKEIVPRRNRCLSTSYDLVVTNMVHPCPIGYGFLVF